eukprot:snap_masked-scaffold_3-processed-gene-2.12-mRNA-1 protein AED:0.66 eAED:0.67 QI:0/-1/0/1/-1/1/1/0/276
MVPLPDIRTLLLAKSRFHNRTRAQDEVVGAIEPIPIEEVSSEHFKQLENDSSPSEVTPLIIQNLVDNIPEEFNEVGIGEGAIEEEIEKDILLEMINNKINESIFNATQKQSLKSILLGGVPVLGRKQSNERMSSLTPIDVDLVNNHLILRSDGYHQTKEEEQFLKLKFQALVKAGIVARAKNPIWGHPVFVVGKKMKLPPNYPTVTHEEKQSCKKDNTLNRFRMVSNMIRLNNITVPTSLNLANLERQLLSIKNSSYYATLDVLSGFDFLPTNPKH